MRIKRIGNQNATVVYTNGGSVLYSYETPVAAILNCGVFRTEKFHSVTTSKHINKYLGDRLAENAPQEFFDDLLVAKVNDGR